MMGAEAFGKRAISAATLSQRRDFLTFARVADTAIEDMIADLGGLFSVGAQLGRTQLA